MVETRLVPCLSDNYAVLVHDGETGETLLVDAPDADAILAALEETGWRLTHVLVTHHHADHVQGLPAIKARTGAKVIGPAAEADRIVGLDETLADGATTMVGPFRVEAIATPGHTAGPLSYFLPDQKLAFTGDTLFAMGCGRLFEGDAATMWASLRTLRERLPDDTRIYCGHEYTQKNAEYAESLGSGVPAIAERVEAVRSARSKGEPTIPTTMGLEKATNPFLMADDPAMAAATGKSEPAEVFAALRSGRDGF